MPTQPEGLSLHCHDAAAEWKRLQGRKQKAWQFSEQLLDAATPALRMRMVELDSKLSGKPVFRELPTLDPCNFLWVLFLVDGEPGSAAWQKTWKDEAALRPLGLRDLYVVVASIELEVAACALLEHAYLVGKGDFEGATCLLEAAVASLSSAEKALLSAEPTSKACSNHVH